MYSDKLEKLATMVILCSRPTEALTPLFPMVIGKVDCGRMISAMRLVPMKNACVFLHVEAVGLFSLLNQNPQFGEFQMDIFNQLHAHVDVAAVNPLLMIAPSSATVPEDGMLVYRTVESLGDLLVAPKANEVVLIRDDQLDMLKCLSEYTPLFGVDVILVSGLPGTTYSPEFESVMWDKPKVAYHSVVNDLIEAQRRQTDTAADVKGSTVYGKEQQTFVRKTGNVKVFTDFEESPSDDEIVDSDR